jgi:hypothetical protein
MVFSLEDLISMAEHDSPAQKTLMTLNWLQQRRQEALGQVMGGDHGHFRALALVFG